MSNAVRNSRLDNERNNAAYGDAQESKKGQKRDHWVKKRAPDINYALIRVTVNPRSGLGASSRKKDVCLRNSCRMNAPSPGGKAFIRGVFLRHPTFSSFVRGVRSLSEDPYS